MQTTNPRLAVTSPALEDSRTTVAAAPDSATGQAFDHLATRIAVQLANQSAATPRKPTIMLRSV